MNHIRNIALRLFGDGIEEDFGVLLDYDEDKNVISVMREGTIWLEVCEPFSCEDTDSKLEIINYEMDEYYCGLSEETAFSLTENFIGALYLADDF